MNIFFLDRHPRIAAQYHLDKHVVKMPTEYLQMLSTAHRVMDGQEYTDLSKNGRRIKRWRHFSDRMEENLYKASHVNHPSNVWLRQSTLHYVWFYQLFLETAKDYEKRYGRRHKTLDVAELAGVSTPPQNMYNNGWVDPPLAMPDVYKVGDAVESYKNYYRGDKASFATWKNKIPDWFTINNTSLKTTQNSIAT